MIADPGYDDQNLYDLSIRLGFQLVCPVRIYRTMLCCMIPPFQKHLANILK